MEPKKSYKIISIISSNVVVWIEDAPSIAVAKNRLKEIEDSNDDCLETTANMFIIDGEIIDHNFKNLDQLQL